MTEPMPPSLKDQFFAAGPARVNGYGGSRKAEDRPFWKRVVMGAVMAAVLFNAVGPSLAHAASAHDARPAVAAEQVVEAKGDTFLAKLPGDVLKGAGAKAVEFDRVKIENGELAFISPKVNGYDGPVEVWHKVDLGWGVKGDFWSSGQGHGRAVDFAGPEVTQEVTAMKKALEALGSASLTPAQAVEAALKDPNAAASIKDGYLKDPWVKGFTEKQKTLDTFKAFEEATGVKIDTSKYETRAANGETMFVYTTLKTADALKKAEAIVKSGAFSHVDIAAKTVQAKSKRGTPARDWNNNPIFETVSEATLVHAVAREISGMKELGVDLAAMPRGLDGIVKGLFSDHAVKIAEAKAAHQAAFPTAPTMKLWDLPFATTVPVLTDYHHRKVELGGPAHADHLVMETLAKYTQTLKDARFRADETGPKSGNYRTYTGIAVTKADGTVLTYALTDTAPKLSTVTTPDGVTRRAEIEAQIEALQQQLKGLGPS